MTQQTIDWLREMDFSSINLDLIYGLPHQTVESFNRTLDIVLAMQPDRLAVFSYAHVPWVKPAQKILEQKILPPPETKLQLLKNVIERLTENDRYIYIGMDHFARAKDELVLAQRNKTLQRNFQGYSTRANADIYAFGMSAISQIPDAYWQNEKDLLKYYAALDAGKVPLSARLRGERRGQDSPRYHHARDVRSRASITRPCRNGSGLISSRISSGKLNRSRVLRRTAWCAARKPVWK